MFVYIRVLGIDINVLLGLSPLFISTDIQTIEVEERRVSDYCMSCSFFVLFFFFFFFFVIFVALPFCSHLKRKKMEIQLIWTRKDYQHQQSINIFFHSYCSLLFNREIPSCLVLLTIVSMLALLVHRVSERAKKMCITSVRTFKAREETACIITSNLKD